MNRLIERDVWPGEDVVALECRAPGCTWTRRRPPRFEARTVEAHLSTSPDHLGFVFYAGTERRW